MTVAVLLLHVSLLSVILLGTLTATMIMRARVASRSIRTAEREPLRSSEVDSIYQRGQNAALHKFRMDVTIPTAEPTSATAGVFLGVGALLLRFNSDWAAGEIGDLISGDSVTIISWVLTLLGAVLLVGGITWRLSVRTFWTLTEEWCAAGLTDDEMREAHRRAHPEQYEGEQPQGREWRRGWCIAQIPAWAQPGPH